MPFVYRFCSLLECVVVIKMSSGSVSISTTTALIYGLSAGFFFLLVFLLVMMGLTNCDCNWTWPCPRFQVKLFETNFAAKFIFIRFGEILFTVTVARKSAERRLRARSS